MNTVSIIGFGRFGQVLSKILSDDFHILAYDKESKPDQYGVQFVDYQTAVEQETIFVCVPIRAFKDIIHDLAQISKGPKTIIDVCSVKVYPVTVMTEHLPENVGIIATHPLFGPDSIDSPEGLKIMMNNTRDSRNQFDYWRKYFQSKAIQVIEMSPEKHDELAAKTQGITHFVGRILRESGITPTEIDTLGFHDLTEVIDQTCNDSWELFLDLQNYNPYTMSMIRKLETSITTIRSKILGET